MPRNARAYISSETYRGGFMAFLAWLARTHEWMKDEMHPGRRKWAFRIFIVLAALEIQVHIAGISYWAESAYWWERIPLMGRLLELIIK